MQSVWRGTSSAKKHALKCCSVGFRGQPWLYLEDLYVREAARGKGVGREMMAYLARVTMERGWAGMVWAVLEWNAPAFAFYRTLGAQNSNGHVQMEISGAALERLAAGAGQ